MDIVFLAYARWIMSCTDLPKPGIDIIPCLCQVNKIPHTDLPNQEMDIILCQC